MEADCGAWFKNLVPINDVDVDLECVPFFDMEVNIWIGPF